jgi:hypothetical protein
VPDFVKDCEIEVTDFYSTKYAEIAEGELESARCIFGRIAPMVVVFNQGEAA